MRTRTFWLGALALLVLLAFGAAELVAQTGWDVPVKGGLTQGSLIYAKTGNRIGAISAVASGQVLTSAGTGTVPAWSASPTVTTWTLSGLTASKPVFTDASKALVSTGTLGADQGGTGLATYAVGDIPYASAATTISKLVSVAAGSYLRSGGVTTAPVWSTVTLPNSAVTGDLLSVSAANVYANITAVAAGQVLASAGTGTLPAYTAAPSLTTLALAGPKLTAGSGTGVTVNDAGSVRSLVYKVTVAYTNLTSAATTHDLTIATLPAKSQVHTLLADVTTPFVCAAVCTTATLSATTGISAGGVEYLESFDIDAAAALFGDADAEVGNKLDALAHTNGGYIPNWSATSPVVVRFTSGTGNWGDGASATNLNAGSVTFYVRATVYP